MGGDAVKPTPLISGQIKKRHTVAIRCKILARMLAAATERSVASLATDPVINSFSISGKLVALFGGALLAIVAASLVVEDQRLFLACRANGGSVDACLLRINGR